MVNSPGTGPLHDRRARDDPERRPFQASGRPRPKRRPNIVFVFADDLGWGDLGCFGSLHNRTPALDKLAAEGLLFRHGYCASPTCSPSRIALLTGRYNGRLLAGLEEPLITHSPEHGIPADHPTLPSLLHGVGYRTAMYGKWHCGAWPWFSPRQAGYEEFFGNYEGAIDYLSHVDHTGAVDLWENETRVQQEGYYPDLITRRALEYIGAADRDAPFFLHLNYTLPHWPWEGRDDHEVSERITRAIQSDDSDEGWALFHFDGGSLAKYEEMVEILDEAIGQVVAALDERGIAEDTIFAFTSDNGGERYAFMWPFVGEKGALEEGGIRVPLILRWPAGIDPGQVTDLAVITMDLTATLLDAAGADAQVDYPLDGVSLLPWLLDGAPPPSRDLVWRTIEQGAVRRDRFKLLYDRVAKPLWKSVGKKEGSRARLFDLEEGPREKADLAKLHPELLAELLEVFHAHDSELLPYPETAQRQAGRAD